MYPRDWLLAARQSIIHADDQAVAVQQLLATALGFCGMVHYLVLGYPTAERGGLDSFFCRPREGLACLAARPREGLVCIVAVLHDAI